MKDIRDFSCIVILGGMVFVFCCFSTSAYALPGDDIVVDIPEPWDAIVIYLVEHDGVLEYVLPPGRDIPSYRPRLNGASSLDVDGSLSNSYTSSDDEPIFQIPAEPIDFVPGYAGQLNLDDIEHAEHPVLPEHPRLVSPIDIDGTLFDAYNPGTNFYEIGPPVGATFSYIDGSFVANPEPSTVLLLGLGALALRRKH
ncbi:MAG: PEP-CTERM sorting domain-containing protein [Planctomycetota bacterium]|nr:MAG: PEP-CTERM sorting domain-containing protein [Planctomycetota bacterium]